MHLGAGSVVRPGSSAVICSKKIVHTDLQLFVHNLGVLHTMVTMAMHESPPTTSLSQTSSAAGKQLCHREWHQIRTPMHTPETAPSHAEMKSEDAGSASTHTQTTGGLLWAGCDAAHTMTYGATHYSAGSAISAGSPAAQLHRPNVIKAPVVAASPHRLTPNSSVEATDTAAATTKYAEMYGSVVEGQRELSCSELRRTAGCCERRYLLAVAVLSSPLAESGKCLREAIWSHAAVRHAGEFL
jgi:hypothetical protein